MSYLNKNGDYVELAKRWVNLHHIVSIRYVWGERGEPMRKHQFDFRLVNGELIEHDVTTPRNVSKATVTRAILQETSKVEQPED